MIKKYTQEDFDSFPRVEDDMKVCPRGDYSDIKKFDHACAFTDGCIFGDGSRFGANCHFGRGCRFGNKCTFDIDNVFDVHCLFGDECVFGSWCSFGNNCGFGEKCIFDMTEWFDNYVYFGARCSFGKYNYFGVGTVFGGVCKCADGAFDRLYVMSGGPGMVEEVTQFYHLVDGNIIVLNDWYSGNIKDYKKWLKNCGGDAPFLKTLLTQIKMAKKMEQVVYD